MSEAAKIMRESLPPGLPSFLRMQATPQLLCLECARLFSVKDAKFHRLRCKTRRVERAVYDGVVQPGRQ